MKSGVAKSMSATHRGSNSLRPNTSVSASYFTAFVPCRSTIRSKS